MGLKESSGGWKERGERENVGRGKEEGAKKVTNVYVRCTRIKRKAALEADGLRV